MPWRNRELSESRRWPLRRASPSRGRRSFRRRGRRLLSCALYSSLNGGGRCATLQGVIPCETPFRMQAARRFLRDDDAGQSTFREGSPSVARSSGRRTTRRRRGLFDHDAAVHEDRAAGDLAGEAHLVCVTSTMVMPPEARSRITWSTSPTISGSRAARRLVEQQHDLGVHRERSARAIATRCFCPPERDAGFASAFSDRPTRSRRASARSRA